MVDKVHRVYIETVLEQIEDAPNETVYEVKLIQKELDEIVSELDRDRQRIDWGHEVAVGLYETQIAALEKRLKAVTKQFNDWKQEMASASATADQLAALAAKFNNR